MKRIIKVNAFRQTWRIRGGTVGAVLAIAALVWLQACFVPNQLDAQPAATAPVQIVTSATSTPASSTESAPADQPTRASSAQTAATPVPSSQGAAPACSSPALLSPAVTEGPYFKAGSPERASLLTPDMPGTTLVLTGYVLAADCKPVAHALLDFWQADANGSYDNSGYTLRGHQFTDASGRFRLTTVVPGLYPGRTEHIHVKVQAPNGPVLTTQLFFPGVANNSSDGIFDARLLMQVQNSAGGLAATYNFVISAQ